MKFNSKTIHGNQNPDKAYASVMPPIYQTSTYVIPEAGRSKKPMDILERLTHSNGL